MLGYDCEGFCCNLINLWEIQNRTADLQNIPVGINFGYRTGELKIVLLIVTVVNDGDDLPFFKLRQSFINFCNGVLCKLAFWFGNSFSCSYGFT